MLLLLYPTSQLITFTCCPSCKSTPSVTSTTLVTHLDGLSGELCGIIRHHQLSTRKSQQSGKHAACDLKQTLCRSSALCFTVLCCRRCHRGFFALWPLASPSSPHLEHHRSHSQGSVCSNCTESQA